MDKLSAEDRALIDEHIAAHGVTQVPRGKSGLIPEYVWSGSELVIKDPSRSGWKKMGFHLGRSRQPKPDQIRKDAEIAAEIREGRGIYQIMQAHQVSRMRVRRIAQERGLEIQRVPGNQGSKPRPLDPALTAKIVPLANGQRSARQIARLVGCDTASVWRRRERLGLDIPFNASAA